MKWNAHLQSRRFVKPSCRCDNALPPVTSALDRGSLKSNKGGKLSIHYNGDSSTTELSLRTMISFNRLSVYGASSDLLKKLAQQISHHSFSGTGKSVGEYEWSQIIDSSHPMSCRSIFVQRSGTGKHVAKSWRKVWNTSGGNASDSKLAKTLIWKKDFSWTMLRDNFMTWRIDVEMLTHGEKIRYLDVIKNFTPNGWIRGNTNIGPVQEVMVTYNLYQ